jgi:hypothetical protein
MAAYSVVATRYARAPHQGFAIRFGKKKSVPTESDEFWKNSDEFRTQFGEISDCKA